jgi:hypothetical protein
LVITTLEALKAFGFFLFCCLATQDFFIGSAKSSLESARGNIFAVKLGKTRGITLFTC